jgi:uncharacterized protein
MTSTVASEETVRRRTWVRPLVITLVLTTITALLFGVPWLGLFPASAQWPGALTAVAAVVWIAAAVAMPALLVLSNTRWASDRAANLSHLLLGVAWIAFAWTIIGVVARLVLAAAGVDNPLRARIMAVALGVVVLAMVAWGSYEARRVPRVRRTDVVLPRLDPALDGLRVAVLADTHFGPLDRTAWSRRLVAAVNELDADVVVHAGDLADGRVAQRRGQVAALADVRAPHRYFVSGNHEYYSNAQAWLECMTELGWTGLHNEHRVVERDGARLVFAGIDDVSAAGSGEAGHGADLDAALAGTRPGDPVVLMAHQPSEVRKAVAAGIDLQLSGHTHGGQIWPFHYLVRLQQPAVQGLTHHGGRTQLYTSRGAGFWGPPLRVFAPSEISLLTLRSA